jgi:hypothetical protein
MRRDIVVTAKQLATLDQFQGRLMVGMGLVPARNLNLSPDWQVKRGVAGREYPVLSCFSRRNASWEAAIASKMLRCLQNPFRSTLMVII